MKFTIYIKGRGWSFQIAESLYKKNYLNYLVTSFPKFYVRKYGIPYEKVKSFAFSEIFQRIFQKINFFFHKFLNKNIHNFYINILDFISDYIHSLFIIKNSTLYIFGFGNSVCQILKKLKKHKIPSIYFLNNCSDNFFDQTLKEEYLKFGIANTYTITNYPLRKRINKSIQQADYVGALSSFQAKTYIDSGIVDKSKILVSLLGADTKLFKPNNKLKNKFVVITVANDVIRKGLFYLIEAFNSLSLDNAELWLVGNINKKLLKRITNLKENIKFLGLVNEFELPKLYNQSSIFCLPTLEDGGPMVIPQAMSCALPVISSKYCIAPDIINDGFEGYIVDPRDVNEISKKIKFLYENEDIRKLMGQNGRKKIEEIGSWDNVSKRIIDLYKNKLQKN